MRADVVTSIVMRAGRRDADHSGDVGLGQVTLGGGDGCGGVDAGAFAGDGGG